MMIKESTLNICKSKLVDLKVQKFNTCHFGWMVAQLLEAHTAVTENSSCTQRLCRADMERLESKKIYKVSISMNSRFFFDTGSFFPCVALADVAPAL